MTDCRQILEQADAALTDVFAPFFCLLFVGLVKAVYAYVLDNIGRLYALMTNLCLMMVSEIADMMQFLN